jgi:aarF domain-containing kinase
MTTMTTLLSRNRRLLFKGALAGGAVLGTAYYWPEVSFGLRAGARIARSIAAVSLIAADYKLNYGAGTELDTASNKRVHERAANRLLWLFQRNGGIYIKLGQHLGTLDFILPTEYTRTLSVLFNRAPTSTPAQVERVIQEEFGGATLSSIFDDFQWPPIGAASLAQVHRARLRETGEPVAVKIQHSHLHGFAQVDIVTASVLVKAVKMAFPRFEFGWLADELRENLPKELNFELEGHNAERTARNFKSSLLFTVPKVHWKYTRKRVLTMEFCDGDRVTDTDALVDKNVSLKAVSDRLTKAYSEMIFVHGFVHCDPHPGNILVRKAPADSDFELVLLDHGLYKELSDDFRLSYARLWQALINGHEQEIERASMALGGGSAYRLFSSILTHRSWDKVRMRSLDQPRTLSEIEAIRAKFPEYFERIAHLLASVPRPHLLLLKTNDLLRCIERTLLADNSSSRSFLIMARYCAFAVYEDELGRRRHNVFTVLTAGFRYVWSVLKYRAAEWLIYVNNRLLL